MKGPSMKSEPTQKLLEKIPHITNTSPYSIHRTDFAQQNSQVLYLHFHPEYELLYLSEGSLEVTIHNSTFLLHAGEALFIPPNMLHYGISNSQNGTFYALVFSEHILNVGQEHISSYLTKEPDNTKYICKLAPHIPWQKDALEYLTKIFFCRDEMKASDIFMQGHILIIWEYLYRHHISIYLEKNKPNTPVREIIEFIHNNYQEDLSLEDMTKIVHMSKEHLCRIFRKSTGQTPISYLKQYRILKSCYYLQETDKKISDICTLVGFNNVSYFNREFLQVLQTTPSQYRKDCRQKLTADIPSGQL